MAEEMTSLSRIIRSLKDDQLTKTIEVRSFSFGEELTSDLDVIPELSAQTLLDQQQKMKLKLEAERTHSENELQVMRQQLEEEIQAARTAWLQEKEVLEQQAYEEGFAKGFEEGNQKIYADMQSKITEANDTVHQAVINGAEYLRSQEQVILDLAIQSANRIIGRSITEDANVFVDIVKRALIEARDAEFIKVYTSSEYYAFVTAKRDELTTLLPPNLLFTIFIDDKLQQAESYIESNHGRMIISVDSQLNELKKSLVEIMESVD